MIVYFHFTGHYVELEQLSFIKSDFVRVSRSALTNFYFIYLVIYFFTNVLSTLDRTYGVDLDTVYKKRSKFKYSVFVLLFSCGLL